jgi:hypothetical protein
MNGGHPWPISPANRVSLGPGVYAWDNLGSAIEYHASVSRRLPQFNIGIYSIDVEANSFNNMRRLDMGLMNDAQVNLFDAQHNALFPGNSGTSHGYDFIARPGTNYGTEYYFSTTVYPKLKIGFTNPH